MAAAAATTPAHVRLIDWDLVEQQTKILATQMWAANNFHSVTFSGLSVKAGQNLKVGDTPWPNGNPSIEPPGGAEYAQAVETQRQRTRNRLLDPTKGKSDWEIESNRKQMNEAIELRAPEKRQKVLEEYKQTVDKSPKWNEAAVAIGGAWIKASTWPPDGKEPLDIILVRGGTVLGMVSTTFGKYFRLYDSETGEWKGGGIGDRSRGWSVAPDIMSSTQLFDVPMEVGDCLMLRVAPVVEHSTL